jgi:hypothetical protein
MSLTNTMEPDSPIGFVITIQSLKESRESAEKTIQTAKDCKFPFKLIPFDAFTPNRTNVRAEFEKRGISFKKFNEFDLGAKPLNVACCFLSHLALWETAINIGHPVFIFEHDCRFSTNPFPTEPILSCLEREKQPRLVTFGAPSYGAFLEPSFEGIGPLTSKKYLPGAHAYGINPMAALALINHARSDRPKPADVFIHLRSFHWIMEYYPWACEVEDTFTTLQTAVKGCKSKFAYRQTPEEYRIIDVN